VNTLNTRVKQNEAERVQALEIMLDEAVENAQKFLKAAEAYKSSKPGTRARDEAEVELSLYSFWLMLKTESVHELLDEATDT